MNSRLCVLYCWQDLWKASGEPGAPTSERNRVWAGFATNAQYAIPISSALRALFQVIQDWKGDYSIGNVYVYSFKNSSFS